MSRRIRVHLRHTGSSKFQFGVTSLAKVWDYDDRHWGYNFVFGRWRLVVRDRNLDPDHYNPKRFFDFGFGRGQLKFERLFMTMTDAQKSSYWEARHPDNWYKHTPMHLQAFIDHYKSSTCCHYFKENQNGST
ncbi:hypothetical protein PP914_gp105 [Arthrobacter phage Qui]|uniref:Uncharacterized protein n=1 Tax=Arthrobacter phage Qui TaxID=2603260 RepID=A0A5B8WKJ8_9CAUD|nr:hypothetical protein PP914_gp105 [Arthrobacter phage Qui]QED11595.1 hypothetical protein SEA_QUI_105 [Arthrobacter phage Qui]QOC56427.1 hypothetical protein SEA_PAELLA_105 [Arthrobacter phage Paella]